MKRQLHYLFTAVLALIASSTWAQVETRNAHSILDARWTESDETSATTDQQLLLSGQSTIHFTVKNTSPTTYTSSGTEYDNTLMRYIAQVEVRDADGNSKGTVYYRIMRDVNGKITYQTSTTKTQNYNNTFYQKTSSTTSGAVYLTENSDGDGLGYYVRSYSYTYNWSEVQNANDDGTFTGTIEVSNGADDDYLYMAIWTDDTYDNTNVTTKYMYSYNDSFKEWSSRRSSYRIYNYDTDAGYSHSVILSELSSTTLRYDIYDDKPLWTVDGENTDAVDADADGNPITTNVQSNRLDAKSRSSQEISVYVHRNLVSGTWSTLCLPFDVEISNIKSANGLGQNVKIAEFDNMDLKDDNVNFKTIDESTTTTLKAGKPYLFLYEGENKDNFFAPHVTFDYTTTYAQTTLNSLSNRKSTKSTVASDSNGSYYYVGLLQPTQNGASSEELGSGTIVYISSSTDGEGNQHLKKLSATGSIKGFRAYLYYPAGAGANAKAANGQGVVKIDEALDNPTAITTVTVDGQPVSNQIFNLQGQFVGTDAGQLPAGIYVRSGKKFVVK